MPYIDNEDKPVYEYALRKLGETFAATGAGDGDLNYVLTRVAIEWLMYHKPPFNYSLRGRVLLAFEAAKLEYYERVMRPYEDKKRAANGDVYPEEVL